MKLTLKQLRKMIREAAGEWEWDSESMSARPGRLSRWKLSPKEREANTLKRRSVDSYNDQLQSGVVSAFLRKHDLEYEPVAAHELLSTNAAYVMLDTQTGRVRPVTADEKSRKFAHQLGAPILRALF